MASTLYGVLKDTLAAVAELRPLCDGGLDDQIGRFEAAVRRALASSRDGSTVAASEEYAALNALCDLHVRVQGAAENVRARLSPIIDDWIAYAASTGRTPEEWDRAHR